MNWFRYDPALSLPDALVNLQQRIQKRSTLNQDLGLVGCYQNHAGRLVGACLGEVLKLLEGSNLKHLEVQYDIRHATLEGGRSWTNGFRLVREQIKTVVIKDFKWVQKNGHTQIVNTPLGERYGERPSLL